MRGARAVLGKVGSSPGARGEARPRLAGGEAPGPQAASGGTRRGAACGRPSTEHAGPGSSAGDFFFKTSGGIVDIGEDL